MIGIASDHGGYETKEEIKKYLEANNYKVVDYGTDSLESVDYPIYALKLYKGYQNKEIEKGIVICTTGIGMSIACNKIKGIRCAKVDNKEEAYLTRSHNDSNILALSSKNKDAIEIVKIFIETPFSNEERHARRIKEIMDLENA